MVLFVVVMNWFCIFTIHILFSINMALLSSVMALTNMLKQIVWKKYHCLCNYRMVL